jgi:hypothetical protein
MHFFATRCIFPDVFILEFCAVRECTYVDAHGWKSRWGRGPGGGSLNWWPKLGEDGFFAFGAKYQREGGFNILWLVAFLLTHLFFNLLRLALCYNPLPPPPSLLCASIILY